MNAFVGTYQSAVHRIFNNKFIRTNSMLPQFFRVPDHLYFYEFHFLSIPLSHTCSLISTRFVFFISQRNDRNVCIQRACSYSPNFYFNKRNSPSAKDDANKRKSHRNQLRDSGGSLWNSKCEPLGSSSPRLPLFLLLIGTIHVLPIEYC